MNIKRYRKEEEPLGFIVNLRNEMNSIFDDFFAPWEELRLATSETVWSPELDIYEDGKKLIVSADLPGMKPEEMSISVSGNTLTIRGEKKQKQEKKGKNYYRLEKSYGSFEKSLELPAKLDAKKVSATYKKGVLEVNLPKLERAKSKKVEVKVK